MNKSTKPINSIKFGIRTKSDQHVMDKVMLVTHNARYECSKLMKQLVFKTRPIEDILKELFISEKTQKEALRLNRDFGYQVMLDAILGNTKTNNYNKENGIVKLAWNGGYGNDDCVWMVIPKWIDSIKTTGVVVTNTLTKSAAQKYSTSYLHSVTNNINIKWTAYIQKQRDIAIESEGIIKNFRERNDKFLDDFNKFKTIESSNSKSYKRQFKWFTNNINRVFGERSRNLDEMSLCIKQIYDDASKHIDDFESELSTYYLPLETPLSEDEKPVYDFSVKSASKKWYNLVITGKITQDDILHFGMPYKEDILKNYRDIPNNKGVITGELRRIIRKHMNVNNGGVTYSNNIIWKKHKEGYSIFGFTLNYLVFKESKDGEPVSMSSEKHVFRLNNQNSFIRKYNLKDTFKMLDLIEGDKKAFTSLSCLNKIKGDKKASEVKDSIMLPSSCTVTYNLGKPVVIFVDRDRRDQTQKRSDFEYDMLSVDIGYNKTATVYPIKLGENGEYPEFEEDKCIHIRFDDDLEMIELLGRLETEKKAKQRKLSKIRRQRLKRNKGLEAGYAKICDRITNIKRNFIKNKVKSLLKLAPMIVIGDFAPSKFRDSLKGSHLQSGKNVNSHTKLSLKGINSMATYFVDYIKLQSYKFTDMANIEPRERGSAFTYSESYTSSVCPCCNTVKVKGDDTIKRNGEELIVNCCKKVLDADDVGAYNIGRKFVTQQIVRKKKTLIKNFPYISISDELMFPIGKEEKKNKVS